MCVTMVNEQQSIVTFPSEGSTEFVTLLSLFDDVFDLVETTQPSGLPQPCPQANQASHNPGMRSHPADDVTRPIQAVAGRKDVNGCHLNAMVTVPPSVLCQKTDRKGGESVPVVKLKRKCGRPRNPIPRHKRESHINAEHRRRGKIQDAFHTLKEMVPKQTQTVGRASKADILFKAVDYCKVKQNDIHNINTTMEALKGEKEALALDVKAYKVLVQDMSATEPKAMVTLDDLYSNYVQERTQDNPRFRIFTLMMRSLFESFKMLVRSDTTEEFISTVWDWASRHLTPANLRTAYVSTSETIDQSHGVTRHVTEMTPITMATTSTVTPPSSATAPLAPTTQPALTNPVSGCHDARNVFKTEAGLQAAAEGQRSTPGDSEHGHSPLGYGLDRRPLYSSPLLADYSDGSPRHAMMVGQSTDLDLTNSSNNSNDDSTVSRYPSQRAYDSALGGPAQGVPSPSAGSQWTVTPSYFPNDVAHVVSADPASPVTPALSSQSPLGSTCPSNLVHEDVSGIKSLFELTTKPASFPAPHQGSAQLRHRMSTAGHVFSSHNGALTHLPKEGHVTNDGFLAINTQAADSSHSSYDVFSQNQSSAVASCSDSMSPRSVSPTYHVLRSPKYSSAHAHAHGQSLSNSMVNSHARPTFGKTVDHDHHFLHSQTLVHQHQDDYTAYSRSQISDCDALTHQDLSYDPKTDSPSFLSPLSPTQPPSRQPLSFLSQLLCASAFTTNVPVERRHVMPEDRNIVAPGEARSEKKMAANAFSVSPMGFHPAPKRPLPCQQASLSPTRSAFEAIKTTFMSPGLSLTNHSSPHQSLTNHSSPHQTLTNHSSPSLTNHSSPSLTNHSSIHQSSLKLSESSRSPDQSLSALMNFTMHSEHGATSALDSLCTDTRGDQAISPLADDSMHREILSPARGKLFTNRHVSASSSPPTYINMDAGGAMTSPHGYQDGVDYGDVGSSGHELGGYAFMNGTTFIPMSRTGNKMPYLDYFYSDSNASYVNCKRPRLTLTADGS